MTIDYENPWVYNGKTFGSSDIGEAFGFVYNISCSLTKREYIGRKYFWQFRTPKGKKRKVKSESDWKKYYGSCPELKEEIGRLGRENFSRTILSLHNTKGKTNFEETKQLFAHGVLTEQLDDGTPKYYNSNILSRYFRKDYYGNEND
tara:strand:- start:2689 stop:3129 length:441 start_codon:yes stop_codon:yes gene_type:complete